MRRTEAMLLAAAAALAAGVPAALLWPAPAAIAPPAPPYRPAVATLPGRPLFAGDGDSSGDAVADDLVGAPALVGIVGRLPDDAIALVRTPEGRTRTLDVGDEVDGWRLTGLAADAALFVRGAERARVPLPAPVDLPPEETGMDAEAEGDPPQ